MQISRRTLFGFALAPLADAPPIETTKLVAQVNVSMPDALYPKTIVEQIVKQLLEMQRDGYKVVMDGQ